MIDQKTFDQPIKNDLRKYNIQNLWQVKELQS